MGLGMELRIEGRVRSGQDVLDTAISDLEFVDGPDGPLLVSVSGPEGGVASYSVDASGLPRPADSVFFVAAQVSGTGPELVVDESGGTTRAHVSGVRTDGLLSYRIGAEGDISGRAAITGADYGAAPGVVAQTAAGEIVLADPGQDGFSVHRLTDDGTLANDRIVQDTPLTHASHVGDVATARIGGSDVLVVASQFENGVTAYTLDGGTPRPGDSVGPTTGLGIMVPTDIEIAETGGRHFVILASAPARGESGALSVMQLDAAGGLTPTDHVLDTRESRFGNVQEVEVVTADGHTYVVAGGGDGGLSLFELLPNGRLVHLDSIAGTAEAGLDDISALEAAVVGGELRIYLATEDEVGIVVLSADISGRGDTLVAPDGGSRITGGTADDILADGSGSDTLSGGDGADRYVLFDDGERDRIAGFDPAEDILDLSGITFLHDVNSLDIRQTSNGAVIRFRDETIVLTGPGGQPLDPDEVRAAIDLSVSHGRLPSDTPVQIGSASEDLLIGTGGSDTIIGNGGNDTLRGLGGRDELDGGAGDDVLLGGGGRDVLRGDAGSDILRGGQGNDRLFGGDGNDRLFGNAGRDVLRGGAGDDVLKGRVGDDRLFGGPGNDRAIGGPGDDLLKGHGGNDFLAGNRGADRLDGGDGEDTLLGGGGNDTLVGGSGNDILRGQGGHDLLRGGAGKDRLVGDAGRDMLVGGPGNDALIGGGGRDMLRGDAGRDVLKGGGGNDRLFGNDGNDRMFGNDGRDMLRGGAGNDLLKGEKGNDRLFGGGGNDRVIGGPGADLLKGHGGADFLAGNRGADRLVGGNGQDRLLGGGRNDKLIGGDGTDVLFGQGGHDLLKGGAGPDRLVGAIGRDTLVGGEGDDRLTGGIGNDVLRGQSGKDVLRGGGGDDRLIGGGGRDRFNGGAGNDRLSGGAGNDVIRGGPGDDTINGGGGRDRIIGGTGDDTLLGRTGADTFVFNYGDGADVVLGFNVRRDVLVLDEDLLRPGMSTAEFIDARAHETPDGIELRLGGGDRILLDGVSDINTLETAIVFG